jgi:16S rRNA (cytidine1402-2'-O)-methyltransferase
MNRSGKLFIVPTPIGNLEDITYRAVRILKETELILAEDTRLSARLLDHYGIRNKLVSHHKFNEHQSVKNIAAKIESGINVALISDAGTPGISDPGYLLIRTCLENGIETECLPGATAFVPALVNSGFSCDRFVFEGFLPQKKGRQKRHAALKEEKRTIVFYESPFRLVKLLEEIKEVFGAERRCCVSRELTKIYEENVRGTVAEALEHFQKTPPKGEIVVVVEGAGKKDEETTRLSDGETE